jgi:hypothetical protein
MTAGVVGLGPQRGGFFFQGAAPPDLTVGPPSAITGHSPGGTGGYFEGITAITTKGKVSFLQQSGKITVPMGSDRATKTSLLRLSTASFLFVSPQSFIPGIFIVGMTVNVPERSFTVYLNETTPSDFSVTWLKLN